MASEAYQSVELKEDQVGNSSTSSPRAIEETQESSNDVRDVDTNDGQEEIIDEVYNSTGFTSEIFKIEIMNLPRFCGFKQLKKRMQTLKLDPVKIKIPFKASYGFATFRNEEAREAALKILDGHQWKGTTFKVKKAQASQDPLLKKRKIDADSSIDQPPQKSTKVVEFSAEQLNQVVTPLWNEPYTQQLEIKEKEMQKYLQRVSREVTKHNKGLQQWADSQKKEHNGLICQVHSIKPSPVLQHYRNKCEFTVGQSASGNEKTVGFRMGSYKDGSIHVMEPTHCLNIPQSMKDVAMATQEYFQQISSLTGFNPIDRKGQWQCVTVRTSLSGQILVILHLNPENLTKTAVEEEKQRVIDFFSSDSRKSLGITSLYFQAKMDQPKKEGSPEDGDYQLLMGKEYIEENLLELNFQISPAAFFQVNTPAAEVLYRTVREWCQISEKSVLLDICCGTGTIGLTMAKFCEKVIGIDWCQQAIDDAKRNAALNGIKNAEYFCGKAENVLPGLIKRFSNRDVVAVVDPPRNGLHPDVIRAIRRSSFVKRLVYVSCRPSSTINNIHDLLREESRRVRGDCFVLTEAVPVDLFPLTDHCELVMLFKRWTPAKLAACDSKSESTAEKKSDDLADGETVDPEVEMDNEQTIGSSLTDSKQIADNVGTLKDSAPPNE